MNIYQKLNACRIALQSTKLKKSGNNKFAGYQYFELGDFLPTINELFHEFGLCSVTIFGKELANLVIYNCDKPEENITFTSPMADAQLKGCHPIQNLGAVETYQRRYLYMAALEIVEHDALDSSQPLTSADKFAKKATNVQPTAGAAEGLSDADKEWLTEHASRISSAFATTGSAQALAMLDKYNLADVLDNPATETEASVFRWSLLDSKCRAAIIKERQKPTNAELAAQP